MAYDKFISVKDYGWELANNYQSPSLEFDENLLPQGKVGVALSIGDEIIDLSNDIQHMEDIFDGWIEMFEKAKQIVKENYAR